MTDTNATTLRNALGAAIKTHVTTNGLKAKDAAEIAGVQYSRLSTILRGDVSKVSADALVNILAGFGYRVTGIVGSGDGTEIVLSLDKAEGHVLPEIAKPEIYGATHDMSGAVDEIGQIEGHVDCREAFGNSGDFEADPDANRVVADDE